MKIPQEVWDILNDDERTAASLAFGQSKSSWQAGEIMEKSHYKYLEIQTRAKKYLQMFTEHYLKYGQLIPPQVKMHPALKEYFFTLIFQRKQIAEAAECNSFLEIRRASLRKKLLLDEFDKLDKAQDDATKDVLKLIREFDRYNNFRILPRELQMPSAFKRRNKTKMVKHIKTLTNMQTHILDFLIKKFKTKSQKNIIFMPLFHRHFEEHYIIIPISNLEKNIKILSTFGIFLFEDEFMAHEFAKLLSDYAYNKDKTCKDGQKFWPEFRNMQELTFNASLLHNTAVTRKIFEDAFKRVF